MTAIAQPDDAPGGAPGRRPRSRPPRRQTATGGATWLNPAASRPTSSSSPGGAVDERQSKIVKSSRSSKARVAELVSKRTSARGRIGVAARCTCGAEARPVRRRAPRRTPRPGRRRPSKQPRPALRLPARSLMSRRGVQADREVHVQSPPPRWRPTSRMPGRPRIEHLVVQSPGADRARLPAPRAPGGRSELRPAPVRGRRSDRLGPARRHGQPESRLIPDASARVRSCSIDELEPVEAVRTERHVGKAPATGGKGTRPAAPRGVLGPPRPRSSHAGWANRLRLCTQSTGRGRGTALSPRSAPPTPWPGPCVPRAGSRRRRAPRTPSGGDRRRSDRGLRARRRAPRGWRTRSTSKPPVPNTAGTGLRDLQHAAASSAGTSSGCAAAPRR